MNKPYVKQYNELGEVINPIQGKLSSFFPNRKKRRERPQPFLNNKKSYQLVVIGNSKFRKVLQIEKDSDGRIKYIEHYLD
jgi:hypothetical protein